MTPRENFLFSTETELLTSVLHDPHDLDGTLMRFLELMKEAAPSAPGSNGYFNGYGRYYIDCGHIELAACECDSPAMLVSIVERQQQLVTQVIARLREEGRELLLANNNHSGLLTKECPVWGAHENYLVERPPKTFGMQILPFLVTRIYAGAGGVVYPSGAFVAGVRHLRMDQPTGGSTTECRAVHSTSREEHLVEEGSEQYRYHLIVGDGHRSQFNLAMQFGATALALKAVFYDDKLQRRLKRIGFHDESPWMQLLYRHNTLATPSNELAIDELVIDTQKLYLEAARRYVDNLRGRAPVWTTQLLEDWECMLNAMQQLDHDWLARRLDAFAKYEFYSAVLQQNGHSWQSLPRSSRMFRELALLDHSYHSFTSEDSIFGRLEDAGLLDHRAAAVIEAGEEETPYVPHTTTRARARALFIKENSPSDQLYMDWSLAHHNGKTFELLDPFAKNYSEQATASSHRLPMRHRLGIRW